MTDLTIVALTPDRVAEAVAVGEAFREEPITARFFRWPRDAMPRGWALGVELLLEGCLAAGSPVLAALADGRVVGLAVVSVPDRGMSIAQALRRLPRVLRMAFAQLRSLRPRALPLLVALRPPSDLARPHYTLEMLGVLPEVQGRGVGGRLLDGVHARTDADPGARGTYLYTAKESTRAFYERRGYREVRVDRRPGVTIWHMFRAAP